MQHVHGRGEGFLHPLRELKTVRDKKGKIRPICRRQTRPGADRSRRNQTIIAEGPFPADRIEKTRRQFRLVSANGHDPILDNLPDGLNKFRSHRTGHKLHPCDRARAYGLALRQPSPQVGVLRCGCDDSPDQVVGVKLDHDERRSLQVF